MLLKGFLIFALSLEFATAAVPLKLATAAPRGTSLHQALLEMRQKWMQAPAGGVALTIYPDVVQGGEADVVRRMNIGQLQAAMLTVVGLSEIDKSVSALQYMPMMFRSLEEFDCVRDKLAPTLEKRLLAKNFVVLFWGDAGWVRFFSKEPARLPADFKRMKMFTWAGDAYQSDLMKAAGYQPVPLEINDILPGLQNGMINAVAQPPFWALAGQMYKPAPHMLEVNWVPLVGATVITKKAWDSIPAEARDAMLKAAKEAGAQIKAKSRAESTEAVATMKKNGLKVQTVTPELDAEWRKMAEGFYPQIRGKLVPADMFDEVQRLLQECRRGAPAVKIGTAAPKGTSPHQALVDMARKWLKAPGGGAVVTIDPDGMPGGEADVVRKMNGGQMQAAMLSAVGLSEIDASAGALHSMPMMFRTLDEVDHVRDKLAPMLEKRLLAKNFVVLFWGDAGWVRFFSKEPARLPADFKRMKMFTWAGPAHQADLMKDAGYDPVQLEIDSILPSLQNGKINAAAEPPFWALASQMYKPAPHMLEVNWAPLSGATVITRKSWEAFPMETRDALLKAAKEAGTQMKGTGRAESNESVATMKKNGLKVQAATPEIEAAWRKAAEEFYPKIRGKIVPADMFDEVQRLLQEYRKAKS